MNKRGWVFFILALSFAAGRPVLGDAPRPRTLVIGASAATGQFELYAPIAGYLAEHLKSDGIDQVKIQLCSSIAEASQWLRNGQLDVFFGHSFSSVALQRRVHTQIILRRWRRGSPDYRPVVITRKDAGLHSLADLRGKKIAVKSRFSPVLQYLPRLAHLHFVMVRNLGEPVGSGVVGCIISRSEENSVYWVLEKKIAAASTDNLQVQHEAKKRINELQLLYQMDPIPQHLVSVRGDLNPTLAAKIKKLFLEMDRTEEGRRVLKDFQATTKFDELPPHALDPIQKILDMPAGPQPPDE